MATDLPDALVALFSATADRSAAAQLWVTAIHAAFYAPITRSAPSSSNKFVELETALVQSITRVLQLQFPSLNRSSDNYGSQAEEDAVWAFVLRVLLLLTQEPKAAGIQPNGSLDHSSADGTTKPSGSETSGATTKRPKLKKNSAQPYAPLAFVVVNALRKLSQSAAGKKAEAEKEEEDASSRTVGATHIARLGETNAELQAFCQRGLEQPHNVVRTVQ